MCKYEFRNKAAKALAAPRGFKVQPVRTPKPGGASGRGRAGKRQKVA